MGRFVSIHSLYRLHSHLPIIISTAVTWARLDLSEVTCSFNMACLRVVRGWYMMLDHVAMLWFTQHGQLTQP